MGFIRRLLLALRARGGLRAEAVLAGCVTSWYLLKLLPNRGPEEALTGVVGIALLVVTLYINRDRSDRRRTIFWFTIPLVLVSALSPIMRRVWTKNLDVQRVRISCSPQGQPVPDRIVIDITGLPDPDRHRLVF